MECNKTSGWKCCCFTSFSFYYHSFIVSTWGNSPKLKKKVVLYKKGIWQTQSSDVWCKNTQSISPPAQWQSLQCQYRITVLWWAAIQLSSKYTWIPDVWNTAFFSLDPYFLCSVPYRSCCRPAFMFKTCCGKECSIMQGGSGQQSHQSAERPLSTLRKSEKEEILRSLL